MVECCANCEARLVVEIASDSFELDEDEMNDDTENTEVILVNEAVSPIFPEFRRVRKKHQFIVKD